MIAINDFLYFPILKTTDAELKAFEHLDDTVKDRIIPIFELTRSRKSKKNMSRSINKRLETLESIVGERPFILDLTTEKLLSNEQIEDILNNFSGGFPLWIKLIKEQKEKGLNVIPVIHYDEQNLEDVKKEILELFKVSDILAFRVPVNDAILYLKTMISMGVSLDKIMLILDAGYQEPKGHKDKSNLFVETIEHLLKDFTNNMPQCITCTFSSFPDSVTKYGEDDKGKWPRYEKYTYRALREKYNRISGLNLKYSDYSSVHPYRYDTTGGQWIPRIDFIDNDYMLYHRLRREDGGYALVAQKVLDDPNYLPIQGLRVWGDNEIAVAGRGIPNGGAPSHWISVRINLYITRTLIELIS